MNFLFFYSAYRYRFLKLFEITWNSDCQCVFTYCETKCRKINSLLISLFTALYTTREKRQ